MEVLDLKAMAEQAVALHQQGNLAQAETLYMQILDADPRLFGPRYYLGLMRLQQGRSAEGQAERGVDNVEREERCHGDRREACEQAELSCNAYVARSGRDRDAEPDRPCG